MVGGPSFIRQNYAPDYFNNNSEPHRRRPAIVNFPCTIWHVALYHHESEDKRCEFVRRVIDDMPTQLKGWRIVRSFSKAAEAIDDGVEPAAALPSEPLTESFLKDFFNHEWFTGPKPPPPPVKGRAPRVRKRRTPIDSARWLARMKVPESYKDTVFCFECVPEGHECWTLRFELHTEYFTFTLFTRFDVIETAEGVSARTYSWQDGSTQPLVRSVNGREHPDLLREIFAKRHGFVANPDLPVEAETGPICNALRTIVKAAEGQVFCDFRGVVTDWRIFKSLKTVASAGAVPLAKPDFCPEDRNGLDHAPHRGTLTFLDQIWPALKSTVFSRASENLVGCYMQSGQAMYLSALGAQGLPPAAPHLREPLTFLVIYDPPAPGDRKGNPHRWRMSRLINLLIEVGVRRVASLRNLQKLRLAADRIRDLEKTLDSMSHRSLMKYHDLSKLLTSLDDVHEAIEGSLAYRANRASKHAYAMRNLIHDLEIMKIPGWLPYDQFVKRRLSNTQDDIARLIPRMRVLEEGIRVRLQLVDTRWSQWVAILGTGAAIVVIFGVLAKAAAEAKNAAIAKVLLDWGWISPEFAKHLSGFIVPSGMEPLTEIVGMAIGLVVAVLLWFVVRFWPFGKRRRKSAPF